MSRFSIPTKQVADIAKVVGYRKRQVNIEVTDKVWLHNLNWDGGSKNEYTWITLDRNAVFKPNLGSAAPWRNKAENTTVEIAKDTIVVRTGWFLGKPSTMTIHVRPENMPAHLLPPQ